MKILYSLLISSFFICYINAYGETVNGYPNGNERETLVFLNMVRMFPIQFRNDYLVPQLSSYPNINNMFTNTTLYKPVGPIRYEYNMNKLARAHSSDMADNNCFSHNSCDNTNIWTRFGDYDACPGGWGENISAGNGSPFSSIINLLCDRYNGSCVPDGDSHDGHRRNIMASGYKTVGVGHAYNKNSQYGNYYTQDFAGGFCEQENSPVYAGYHTMISTQKPRFIAVYSNSTVSYDSFSLIYNDTSYDMKLTYGNKYSAVLTLDNVPFEYCAPYYFEVLDSNKNLTRYPEEGFLRLSTNSSCESWSETLSSASTLNLSIYLIASIILSLLFI